MPATSGSLEQSQRENMRRRRLVFALNLRLCSPASTLSCVLNISFVLIARYNMGDRRITQCVEKCAYWVNILVSPIIPSIGLVTKAFGGNPLVQFYSFINAPPGCGARGNPCVRGDLVIELLLATHFPDISGYNR